MPYHLRAQGDGSEDGYPRELYEQIAKLGWTGLIVPEKFGGAGLGMLDMAMILEEGGYAAMPGPFLFSSVLAAGALKLGGSEQLNSKWLTALAEGKAIGTVAVVEGAGSIDPRDINTMALKGDLGWRLNGTKMFVPYAHVADFIVVAAKRDSDIRLFVVDAKSPGVTINRSRIWTSRAAYRASSSETFRPSGCMAGDRRSSPS